MRQKSIRHLRQKTAIYLLWLKIVPKEKNMPIIILNIINTAIKELSKNRKFVIVKTLTNIAKQSQQGVKQKKQQQTNWE
jgi:hypothetical protein